MMRHVMRGLVCLSVAVAYAEPDTANLVRNPGFEQTDASGETAGWTERKPVYRFENGAGRDGSRGLVFVNDDPAFYSFPLQNLEVVPGRRYDYEVWVRTEDLKDTGKESGATVCVEWFNGDAHLGGSYPEGIRGTSDGWQRIHGVTRPAPPNATHASIAPYVRRGMTGKAWFDDLKVTRHIPPPVQTVVVSGYRRGVSDGPVTVFAILELGELGIAPDAVEGAFTFMAADGQTVHRAKPDALTLTRATCTVDASVFAPGDYTVRFDLAMRGGPAAGQAQTQFSRVPALSERRARIDSHRRLLLDGVPFFPLGMYWLDISDKHLDVYAKGPFNCLMPYNSPDTNRMDACHARGLKVIYSVKDFYSGTPWAPKHIKTEADEIAEIRQRVALHGRHPALLAWYINDEMPVTMMDRLAARQRLMEELDPDHPTWAVLCKPAEVDAYMEAFDVIGTDPYPVPKTPVGTALEWTRTTRDLTHNSRAMWQVPQVFDWGAYPNRGETRAPTLAEMRAMAWQCIAAGANGLVFYSFFDLVKMEGRDPFERRWADVCAMAEEIKRHIPVLLSVEPAPLVTHDGPASIETRVWRKGGEVFLLAVNGATETVDAVLSVQGGFTAMRTEFGDAPTVTEGGKLAVRLTPLEPLLVRLTPNAL